MTRLVLLQNLCIWVVIHDKGLCTVIKKEAQEGEVVVLSCGGYCERNYCGCGQTDWYWTDEKRPWHFVTKQIWARLGGQSFYLNSVCHEDLPRSTLLQRGFELEIAPVSRSDDARTFCCYSGEIHTGTPLLFCTSLMVHVDIKLSTTVVVVIVVVAGISCLTFCLCVVRHRQQRKQERHKRRRHRRRRSGRCTATALHRFSAEEHIRHNRPETSSSSVVVHITPISRSSDEQLDQDSADACEDNSQREGSEYDDFEYYIYESVDGNGRFSPFASNSRHR